MCSLRPFPLFCTYFSLPQPGFFKKTHPLPFSVLYFLPSYQKLKSIHLPCWEKGGTAMGRCKQGFTDPCSAVQRGRAGAAARVSHQRRKRKTGGSVGPAVAGGDRCHTVALLKRRSQSLSLQRSFNCVHRHFNQPLKHPRTSRVNSTNSMF